MTSRFLSQRFLHISRGFSSTSIRRQSQTTQLFLNGEFVNSQTNQYFDLYNPATQELVTRVPQATQQELEEAVKSAEYAFKDWRKTSLLSRQRIMLDLQQAIRDNMDVLATSITTEQGKTFNDAKGDVLRGLRKSLLSLCP